MRKRLFRPSASSVEPPRYPDTEGFEPTRRRFLAQLGAAALGGGVLAALMQGCGDAGRALPGGVPDTMEAPIDADIDSDLRTTGGVPDTIQAPIDGGSPPRDGTMGVPDAPPAPLDGPRPRDTMGLPDSPRARIDAGSPPTPDAELGTEED
jgi:hypothetical protein